MRCRALPCGAVLCGVVPCRVVRCCAVMCRSVMYSASSCAFSLVHTRRQRYQADRVGESQSVLEHFLIGEPSLSIFGLRGNCLYYTGIQQQPNHASYEYVFVEYLQQYREHSTAQHSAVTPAQSGKPNTYRSA